MEAAGAIDRLYLVRPGLARMGGLLCRAKNFISALEKIRRRAVLRGHKEEPFLKMRLAMHNQMTCRPSMGWLAGDYIRPQAVERASRVLREAKTNRVNHVRAMGKWCFPAR